MMSFKSEVDNVKPPSRSQSFNVTMSEDDKIARINKLERELSNCRSENKVLKKENERVKLELKKSEFKLCSLRYAFDTQIKMAKRRMFQEFNSNLVSSNKANTTGSSNYIENKIILDLNPSEESSSGSISRSNVTIDTKNLVKSNSTLSQPLSWTIEPTVIVMDEEEEEQEEETIPEEDTSEDHLFINQFIEEDLCDEDEQEKKEGENNDRQGVECLDLDDEEAEKDGSTSANGNYYSKLYVDHILNKQNSSQHKPLTLSEAKRGSSSSKIPSMFPATDRSIKCAICAKVFPNRRRLKNHMPAHSEERPFKCSHQGCGSCFKWKKGLNRHVKDCHS